MSPYVFEGEVDLSLIDEPQEPGGSSERPEEMAALEKDIKKKGIQKPLCVFRFAGRYRIYDGKSRFIVAKNLGMKKVPVKVLWEF